VYKIMKIRIFHLSILPSTVLLILGVVVIQPAARSAEGEKTVVIVANDTLRFSVSRIDSSPGQKVHVQLRDEGTVPKESMGHNWILLDSDSEAIPYAMAAMSARDVDYMPKAFASHVLADILLLGPKEVGNVTFNAPVKPGNYPFICSFPGHEMAGMRGELVVK
jgi:azurin